MLFFTKPYSFQIIGIYMDFRRLKLVMNKQSIRRTHILKQRRNLNHIPKITNQNKTTIKKVDQEEEDISNSWQASSLSTEPENLHQ